MAKNLLGDHGQTSTHSRLLGALPAQDDHGRTAEGWLLAGQLPSEQWWGLWGTGYAFDVFTAECPPRSQLAQALTLLRGGAEPWASEACGVLGLVCRQRKPLKRLLVGVLGITVMIGPSAHI